MEFSMADPMENKATPSSKKPEIRKETQVDTSTQGETKTEDPEEMKIPACHIPETNTSVKTQG